MTSEVKLSYPDKGIEVDLTSNDVRLTHMYNNPVVIIPTPITAPPTGATPYPSQIIGFNTNAINIGFVANRYMLSFTLYDGLGTFDFSGTGTTKYEKIVYMTNSADTVNAKVLTINGAVLYVHIESFEFSVKAGDKDLMQNCTVNCIAVKDIKMV